MSLVHSWAHSPLVLLGTHLHVTIKVLISKVSVTNTVPSLRQEKQAKWKHDLRSLSHCLQLQGTNGKIWLLTHCTGSNENMERQAFERQQWKISNGLFFFWKLGQRPTTHGGPLLQFRKVLWRIITWGKLSRSKSAGKSCRFLCFTSRYYEQLEISNLSSFPNIFSGTIWESS